MSTRPPHENMPPPAQPDDEQFADALPKPAEADAAEDADEINIEDIRLEAVTVEEPKVIEGIVAIVGRPNVGKSTLFNRMIEQRQAIVDDQPGVTRDRNYGVATWNGKLFSVIDTGGYVPQSADVFDAAIREQVEVALEEADVVVFVVDVKDGLTPYDAEILDIVRRRQKDKVLLAANKADNYKNEMQAAEFYALGLKEVFPISALAGSGTGDLLDRVVELLPEGRATVLEEGIPKLAIIGRPNVGKSSFVNALLGRANNIVTPIAGTTRDSIATRYKAFGYDFYLVDTAGLRRKARVKDNVEFFSTIRTLRAIEECDLALLMLDAQHGIEAQDLAILNLVVKHRKGLIILVNKWDLVDKTPTADRDMRKAIEERLLPLSGVPILFVSAHEKTRLVKALQTAKEVYDSRKRRLSTHELNEVLLPLVRQTPPAGQRGKLVRIKYVTQVPGPNPTFIFFSNYPMLIQEGYKRFLENKLREHFGFQGWPISIFFKES
jgi:GTP-binding protein